MNIFTEGLQQLSKTLASDTEVDITYKHKGTQYNIKATRGSINWSTLNRIGDVALGENFREYIIRTELLSIEPQDRDQIIDGTETYEVFKESTSTKCWRYCDPYKILMRISTRRIA